MFYTSQGRMQDFCIYTQKKGGGGSGGSLLSLHRGGSDPWNPPGSAPIPDLETVSYIFSGKLFFISPWVNLPGSLI